MTDPGTRYAPAGLEEKWYTTWNEKGFFAPEIHPRGTPFSIVIPPPNITGILHMGHALNNTLQDVITRWRRMQGHRMLWLPGTDHAGIATQNVVERELRKEGKHRTDLGREQFVERCWEWKEKYGGIIIKQLQRLGCSCDWSRLRFTLDEGLAHAVRTAFKKLYDDGLIYKGTYIINWCPRCATALSDDEVEHEEHIGKLWYIRYPLEDGSGSMVVATTRPETMLGDSAVAVNPKDERYTAYIGKRCILPMLNRPLPIIADEYVQREFGTGAVKITPAHDPNDYLVGKRHNLDEINVLTPDAHINENGGPYAGMDRYVCRERLLGDLQSAGLIEKIEEHIHAIGHCYRCDTVIEPYISLQWFVKMRPLAEPALDAVRNGKTRYIPQMWENTYFAWLENVRDWCISRQLWWGHRIPAWYCQSCNNIEVTIDEAPLKCSKCGGEKFLQDEDVLDTWFSSALWPFSTLGWPDSTDDMKRFYPTSVLVTAHDIIFFWVARMIMMGLKFMDDVPFREVYINALILDEEGEKMSKSKGNAIDPIEIIKEFGADSLRLTLSAYAAQGRKICLSAKRFEGYRNFLNKVWNATRFVFMNTADLTPETLGHGIQEEFMELSDRWILSRYYSMMQQVNHTLEGYRFNDMIAALYQFVWHEYCDWYIELVKPRLYSKDKPGYDEKKKKNRDTAQGILALILEGVLRLFHPVIPFVTEDMWQILHERYGSYKGATSEFSSETLKALGSDSIMIAPWPAINTKCYNPEIESDMTIIQNLIGTIRNIRGEMDIPPGEHVQVTLSAPSLNQLNIIRKYEHYFHTMSRLESLILKHSEEGKEKGFHSMGVEGNILVAVKLPESLREKEKERLQKEMAKLETQTDAMRKKLENQDFLSRAPETVIEREKCRLEKAETELSQLRKKWKELIAE